MGCNDVRINVSVKHAVSIFRTSSFVIRFHYNLLLILLFKGKIISAVAEKERRKLVESMVMVYGSSLHHL